jgi:hypothetical protein
MANPSPLEIMLYLSLRSMSSCSCTYKRDGRGVPVWDGIPLARVLMKQCSRCAGIQMFETIYPEYQANVQATT